MLEVYNKKVIEYIYMVKNSALVHVAETHSQACASFAI